MELLVIILIVLGIWFVGSVVFGLLAGHFLRFSRASCEPEQLVGSTAHFNNKIDDERDFPPIRDL
jgi:hypothetical protein